MSVANKDRLLIENEGKTATEKLDALLKDDSEEGIQFEKESCEKNSSTTSVFVKLFQRKAERKIDTFFGQHSKKEFLQLLGFYEINIENVRTELTILKSSMEEFEPLRLALKQKYMLQYMELCGKPDEFSRQCWDSEKSRSEKWQRFLSEPLGPYPFIESFIGFLKHISPCNDYCQELVEIMFNMTDRMMQSYFIGGPLDESPIESKKIADAVLCLEMMEMEGSLFLFYRFETIENEREGAAKVTTKPRTGNTEGVQPQNETEGKNGDTELSVNQRVKRVYGNFSREELRKLVIEADVEEQKFKFKVSTVKSYLKELESIRYVSKLQFILETLEWYGKPEKVDRHHWNFEVARTAKWKQIFAERSENHCLVQRFLDCLKTSIPTEEEHLQSIETIFLECNDMLVTYFVSNQIPLHIFRDERLVTIVGCLEMMDDEISKFHRIQKM